MWRNNFEDDEIRDEMILITIKIFHGISHSVNVNYKMDAMNRHWDVNNKRVEQV